MKSVARRATNDDEETALARGPGFRAPLHPGCGRPDFGALCGSERFWDDSLSVRAGTAVREAKLASDPKRLQAQLEAAVPDIALTFRAMFGGILAYADGKPVASLSDVGLALKLVAEHQEALLKSKGAKRLQYEPDQPPSKSYIIVPPSLMRDTDRLHDWVLKSVECNKPSQKPRAKRSRN